IGDDLIVGDPAFGAYLGGDVVGCSVADATVQIRTNHVVAMIGKAPRKLLVQLIPTGQMMHEHHTRERPVAFRSSNIRVDLVAVAGSVRRWTRGKCRRSSRVERVPHT